MFITWIVVMVTWVYSHVQTHQIVYINYVYVVYANYNLIKKKNENKILKRMRTHWIGWLRDSFKKQCVLQDRSQQIAIGWVMNSI